MGTAPRSISDTELSVLKALWQAGPITSRDVHALLIAQGRSWAFTTVQTLLRRLEDKGFVDVRDAGRAHVFEAAVSQSDLLVQELEELADRICEGETTPLMLTLMQGQSFSTDELRQFRTLLDSMESKSDKKSRKGRSS